MPTQYDKIATKFQKAADGIQRKYSLLPSFFLYLGDIKGRRVLDLACGDGYFSRLMKKCGALEVVGVDISKKMLVLAKQEEKKNPLGIKYLQYDVAKLPKLGEFHLVNAAFLLHYAQSKQDLFSMCKNIYENLGKGGKFIAFNLNPLNPLLFDGRYGFTITGKKPLREGDALTVKLSGNQENCAFQIYFWNKKTYEQALRSAGFKKINWQKAIVSQDGIKKFGKDFWQNYEKQPPTIVIECAK